MNLRGGPHPACPGRIWCGNRWGATNWGRTGGFCKRSGLARVRSCPLVLSAGKGYKGAEIASTLPAGNSNFLIEVLDEVIETHETGMKVILRSRSLAAETGFGVQEAVCARRRVADGRSEQRAFRRFGQP